MTSPTPAVFNLLSANSRIAHHGVTVFDPEAHRREAAEKLHAIEAGELLRVLRASVVKNPGCQAASTKSTTERGTGTGSLWSRREPNEGFGGQTPMQVVERGEADRLWQMIHQVDANVAN